MNEPASRYDRLVDGLLAADIEPWLCLYHWDLPQALEDLGGWMNREAVTWFADYTTLIATRFGDRVKRFATFNEPSILNLFGRSMAGGTGQRRQRAIHHVNLAHGTAVDVIREKSGASIGSITIFSRAGQRVSTRPMRAAERLDTYWNWAFPYPQCRGEYPFLMRSPSIAHIQPGDMVRTKSLQPGIRERRSRIPCWVRVR